jgi:hypothetical protein
MMRVLLAASVLALAAAHAAPPHAKPHRASPARALRAVIVSGNAQTAHAYIASGKKRYQTDFPNALVVRVTASPPPGGTRYVVFTCVTNGCTFAPADQPNGGTYVDRVADVDNAYKVKIHNGTAALRVTTEVPVATGTYTVRADPSVQKGERAVPASFQLTAR